jgi:hypothetical protein
MPNPSWRSRVPECDLGRRFGKDYQGGRGFCQGSRQQVSPEPGCANPGSCGLQDGQHGRGPPEELESAAIGGNMLVVAGARAKEVSSAPL